jgi:hypothetical protein
VSDFTSNLPLYELAFKSLEESVQREAEQAGEWLIGRIRSFGPVIGYELTDWDLWILRRGAEDIMRAAMGEANGSLIREKELGRQYIEQLTATVNACVLVAREAMVFEKKQRVETVVVRPGLRVPVAWEDRYELVYETGLPWTVSVVMQNAFLGNPLAGEKRPWKSR